MESITGSFPFCSRLIAVFTSPGSFPSSKKPHFQNEAKCKTIFMTMSFTYLKIKNCFHSNGFAVDFSLNRGLGKVAYFVEALSFLIISD